MKESSFGIPSVQDYKSINEGINDANIEEETDSSAGTQEDEEFKDFNETDETNH